MSSGWWRLALVSVGSTGSVVVHLRHKDGRSVTQTWAVTTSAAGAGSFVSVVDDYVGLAVVSVSGDVRYAMNGTAAGGLHVAGQPDSQSAPLRAGFTSGNVPAGWS